MPVACLLADRLPPDLTPNQRLLWQSGLCIDCGMDPGTVVVYPGGVERKRPYCLACWKDRRNARSPSISGQRTAARGTGAVGREFRERLGYGRGTRDKGGGQ